VNGPNDEHRNSRWSNLDSHRPEQWPSRVVFGLYAEVKAEKAVNELSWELARHQVADEAAAFLAAEAARRERRRTARAEGWKQGEPGE
jgi:nitroimidazol reductase NimA-like FMN-containing flavoprotein (pyridoxamine 5'-phosphate oxidase superfamily)